MKISPAMTIKISVILILALMWVSIPAFATGDYDDDSDGDQSQDQQQDQQQGQDQTQGQEQTVNVNVEGLAGGAGVSSVNNEGNSLSVSSNYEAQAPDVVLIPNNNTERCLRVWGLSFSNQSGGGGIGVPMRSRECDLEAAADDAFAQGNIDLGWMLKCKQKSMKKAFANGGNWKQVGEKNCFSTAMEANSQLRTINTLTDRLTEVNTLRETELKQYRDSRERLTEECSLSKNRLLEACRK